jgi:hypothetical protein
MSFLLMPNVYGQEEESLFDLFEELEEKEDTIPPQKEKVYHTFGGTHLINGESIETIDKNVWSFIISHRFGRVNDGWRDFFGLDQASVRIAMEYGILDNLTVGAARSTFEKTYDFYVKYRFLEQVEKGMPISVAYFGDMAINSQKFVNDDRDNYFSSRLSFTNQLLIARKFNDWFSLQIMPTVVHQNLVETKADPNTLFVMGVGAKVKMNKRMAVLLEYYPRIKDNPNNPYKDAFAFGIDLVTGGHVFQFQFTNSNAMHTAGFTRKTTGDFFKGDIHFGFNVSRTFGKNAPKKKRDKSKVYTDAIQES